MKIVLADGVEVISDLVNQDNIYKKRAFERLKELRLPTKKSEEYRYFGIENILSRDFNLHRVEETGEIVSSQKIVIVDGVVKELPVGVEVEVGCSSTIDLEMQHFDPIYYLSHAISGDIISLRFKKDANVTIEHRFTKPASLLAYRVALYIDANSSVLLNEQFVGDEAKESLILNGYDIFLSRDANLELIKSQTLNRDSFMPIASHRFKLDESSSFSWRSFDFGSSDGIELAFASLHKRAYIKSRHLIFAKESSKRGLVTKYNHIGEHSSSDQKAKTILQDDARGVFDALIKVEKSAKYTKAHQNSKAILLNDRAYMVSKPQLEIYIDELEASHGSTTGQLDEKALFYLRSRGLREAEARRILILAFANELIDEISNEKLRDIIHQDFEIAYYGESRLECIETCHNCEETILGS